MPDSLWNLATRTLGGLQFWGDVCAFHGWRIQHNVFTNHFRLLDPSDVRWAWGSRFSRRVMRRAIARLSPLSTRSASSGEPDVT